MAMRKRYVIPIALVFAAILIVCTLWRLMYAPSDPKYIGYVLWKHGLWSTDLDKACGSMIGDCNRDSLVLGKTKEQLRKQFGYVRTLDEADYYLRHYGYEQYHKGKDVLFLRDSPWMVVFKDGKAVEMYLIKGV